jgi:hypothetical protein
MRTGLGRGGQSGGRSPGAVAGAVAASGSVPIAGSTAAPVPSDDMLMGSCASHSFHRAAAEQAVGQDDQHDEDEP